MENRANQDARLRDWLNADRAQSLDHDLSSKIKKKLESTPSPSSVSHKYQLDNGKKNPNEELVKYMSNLPSYLQKGNNHKEKALSFGVLDWKRLEKWQHNHKHSFYPSSSTDSSYFTTDISSARTSVGQRCSPVEIAVKETDEFADLTEKSDKLAKGEPYRKYQSFSKLQGIKSKNCEKEDIEVQSIRRIKTRNGKSFGQAERLGNLGSDTNPTYPEKGKHKVLSDDFESNHRGGMRQPISNIKLSSKSPSHSSKHLISSSKGSDLVKEVVSEPKIGIVENHKVRNSSPNRMLNFGLNRFSRRSSSLDLSSEPVRCESETKKDVDHFGPEIPELKYPSPARKFSFGGNRFRRRSSSLDFSNVPKLSSQHDPYMSDSKKDEGTSTDKPNIGRKSQMSPLRSMLDPLLKPKAVNSDHHADTNEKYSENSYLQSPKPSNGKNKPSPVQALVQMSIKNGLPLYTFADDKTNGVLAATMKKVTALKESDSSWIYTFFNVDEVKKKNSWIQKARRGETHNYVPSVTAQMRVSDIRHNPVSKFSTREFVSLPVDVRENDQHTSKFLPKDELAAIIVKFQKEAPSCMDEVRRCSEYLTDPPSKLTVILPGGSHGLPSKGKPSPLIERWKSGGLCDCGGWDLGCKLNVLTSQAEFGRGTDFTGTYEAADVVELLPQGEVVDNRPMFILSPFKEHVYSVEFDSSISFLQAFSICIAILNCRKPYDLSELSKLFEEETESTVTTGDVIKAPNPPLSPIGRV